MISGVSLQRGRKDSGALLKKYPGIMYVRCRNVINVMVRRARCNSISS